MTDREPIIVASYIVIEFDDRAGNVRRLRVNTLWFHGLAAIVRWLR